MVANLDNDTSFPALGTPPFRILRQLELPEPSVTIFRLIIFYCSSLIEDQVRDQAKYACE